MLHPAVISGKKHYSVPFNPKVGPFGPVVEIERQQRTDRWGREKNRYRLTLWPHDGGWPGSMRTRTYKTAESVEEADRVARLMIDKRRQQAERRWWHR